MSNTRQWLRRILLGLVLVIALGAVIGVIVVSRQEGIRIVRPERTLSDKTPDNYGITDWESVTFPSTDGLRLGAWFIPPDPASDGSTIIFVHGLGSNRGGLLDQADMLVEAGYGALLIELRGHGQSEGETTTFGYTEVNDVQGAVDFLESRPEVNAERLGLVGESLGAATAVQATARIPEIDVLVEESSFTTLEDNVAEGVRVIAGLPPFPFAPLMVYFGSQEAGLDIGLVRPVDDIARIAPRPVLIIHGRQDELVPVESAMSLYAAAGEPKQLYIIEGAGHYPLIESEPQVFRDTLVGFFAKYLPNGFTR